VNPELAGALSCTVICRATVMENGVAVGVLGDILPGGTITLDTTAENLRTCTFQCTDPSGVLTPGSKGTGVLEPATVEILLEKGFLIEGVPYLYGQGVFAITEVDTLHGAGGNILPGVVLTIDGTDRSGTVQAAEFNDSYQTTAGHTVPQVILAILASQAPWVKANIAPTDFVIAQQTYAPGDDPWAAIVSIAQAAGMVAYFDGEGILVVRPTPAAGQSPAVVAIQDGPGNFATDITAVVSNQPGYNGVIVTGTNPTTGETVSGSAYDTNPNSRTYAYGAYGFQPAPPVQVSTATTPGQCAAAAALLLPQVLGLTQTVAMDILPIPFLDAYDVGYLENGPTKIAGNYVLQLATVSLDYSVLDNVTFIPIGSPIDELVSGAGPSVAQFAPTNPVAAGDATYNPNRAGYTWTPYSGSSTQTGGSSAHGASGLLRLGTELPRVLFDGARFFQLLPNLSFPSWKSAEDDGV